MPSIADTFPCPACSAAMEYAPGTDLLRCPQAGCGGERLIPVPPGPPATHPYDGPADPGAAPGTTGGSACPACGTAKPGKRPAMRCRSCGSSLVAQLPAPGPTASPDAMIPFHVSRDSAQESFSKWISSRWFAPRGLKRLARVEITDGAYLPYWNFRAVTRTSYVGQRGHTVARRVARQVYYTTWDSKGRAVQTAQTVHQTVYETVWGPRFNGSTSRAFTDTPVPVPACSAMTGKLPQWPVAEAIAYQAERVAGFRVIPYDIDRVPGWAPARKEMAKTIRSDCHRDIGGDAQRLHSASTDYSDVTYSLLLLPIWVFYYQFNGKQRQVLINGRTGALAGQRPYSPLKITATILVALAIIAAVVLYFQFHVRL
jgi:hypothetical protein